MCIAPLNLKDRTVACGQCKACLRKKAADWSVRIEHEQKSAKSAAFLTLTYNDENVPWIDSEDSDYPVTTLVKKDLQLFIKRIKAANSYYLEREKIDWPKVAYFATGEYGGKTRRAHYHMIIFNIHKNIMYNVSKYWNKGFVKVGTVRGSSIQYVSNYMLFKNIDRLQGQARPFTLSSNFLGAEYVAENFYYHYNSGDYKLKKRNKKRNLPRYYSDKLFDEEKKEDVNLKKSEEFNEYQKEMEKEAIEKDPLDPHGYMIQKRKHKEEILFYRTKRKHRKL